LEDIPEVKTILEKKELKELPELSVV